MRIARASLFLIALSACASAQSPPPAAIAELRACIAGRAARDEFSGVMLVAEQGRILWKEAYGYADAARQVANTPETRFNIASMGKMFTAVAIAQLADEGRLRFGDPIALHLPGLAPEAGAITIDELLTHRSGLRDYLRPENRPVIQSARIAADLLPAALADGLAFAPGSDWAYSNSGYVVLGAIVERLSGLSYPDYLQQRIFAPAGMAATSLDGTVARAAAMTRRRPGGRSAEGPPRPAPQIGSAWGSPAGGAVSTVGDLLRFGEALRRHRLTRPETTELLWRAHLVPGARNGGEGQASYGYGFNRLDLGGARLVGHGGGALGVNAQFEIDPEAGRVVAILSNYDPPAATEAVRAARRALLGGGAVCS